MKIGTAERSSTFSSQGEAIARLLSETGYADNVDLVDARFASTENAEKIGSGDIDVGFMAANWVPRALTGGPPFSAPIDLRIVAPMNVGPMYFIARPGLGIESLADLRGRRVSVGPERSGTRQHAESILSALGMSLDDIQPVYLDFAAGAEALKSGDIDAQLQCPYPNSVMTRLDRDADFEVIGLKESEFEAIVAASPVYSRAVMPAGSLRALRADSLQAGVLNVLVAQATTDEELVAGLARSIALGSERLAEFNGLFSSLPGLIRDLRGLKSRFEREGVAFHAGAERAFAQLALI